MEAEQTFEKLDANLIWTNDEARQVANFLEGKPVDVSNQHSPNRLSLWAKVKEKISVGGRPEAKKLQEITRGELEKEQIDWSSQTRSKVIQQVIIGSLRKFGIWDENETRKVIGISGPRERSNFSQDEMVGPKISELGYVSPEDGGPDIISKISAPVATRRRDVSDDRDRMSLAHEASHVIRTLTNKDLWEGSENAAKKHWIRRTKRNSAKMKNIGGFYVGSNQQGSEAVGQLFSEAVGMEAEGKTATINNILSKLEPVGAQNDYSVSLSALKDHLRQLQNLGLGEVHTYDIVALGTFGYVTYEKIPALIKLGVLNQDKFGKMKKVVKEVANWLVEGSQNI